MNTLIFLSKFAKTLFTRSQYCFIDQSSEIWIWNWSKRCHDFKHLTSAKTVDWTADYDKIIVLLKYEINRPLAWLQCGLWQVVIPTGYVLLRFSRFVCLFVFDRGAREAIRDVSGLGQHQPSAERVDSQLFRWRFQLCTDRDLCPQASCFNCRLVYY